MFKSTLIPCLTLALVPVVACQRANGESRDTVRARTTSTAPAVRTQDPPDDPCAVLALSDVQQVLGPLTGPGKRARSAERPDVDSEGSACVYTLAGESRFGGPAQVAVQIVFAGASLAETGFGMVKQVIAKELTGSPNDTAPVDAGGKGSRTDASWDYTGGVPGLWVGRIGHLGVQVGYRRTLLPRAQIEQLASRIRDRIPDLPIAVPLVDPNDVGKGKDPCSLLSPADVETTLGPLLVRPYRSQESTPFVDGSGTSCTYYRGHHRVLILTPTWTDAQTQFRMAAGLGQGITSMLGVGEQSADTLDGPWDQATGSVDGRLYFLKGDRMLEMDYKSSGVDAATVIRLARAAVAKLGGS